MISSKTTIHPNVKLGIDVVVEDYVIIGEPPVEMAPGELETVIGEGAVIRSHTVIYAGTRIGEGFRTGHHVLIREHNRIGARVSIGTGTVIEHHVIIEDDVRIHSQAFIPEMSFLRERCWIGPRVCVTNARYPLSSNVKSELAGADIGIEAKVGANATILPGVRIGDGALVGAGAVVVKDVRDGAVMVGNPARQINTVDRLPYGKSGR